MYALKEKVTEKLSRLLGDSPSQPYEAPQDNLYSKQGSNSFSSFFSFIHPSATTRKTEDDSKPVQSEDDFKPVQSEDDFKRVQSQPVRCSSKGLALLQCENVDSQAERILIDDFRESASTFDEHETPVSARSTCASEIFEDATEPQSPWNIMPNLTEESSFIYTELYEFLQSSLPNIVKGCQWVLLYSTLRHGISLRTLIRKSADLSGPGLLIIGDRKGAIFGGLVNCPLKPCPKRKYQGTNQTFVFTTRYGEPRLFRATGANRYFYLCLNDLLAFGGGGNFALSLDEDLLTGSSGPCETFGNSCLAHDPEYELKNVELWGFAHASRYVL